jgi:hypothetical protein
VSIDPAANEHAGAQSLSGAGVFLFTKSAFGSKNAPHNFIPLSRDDEYPAACGARTWGLRSPASPGEAGAGLWYRAACHAVVY